jgi:hypothetical protein
MTAALPLLCSVVVSACGSSGHEVAEEGRRLLIGIKVDDLQTCAGIPTRSKRLSDHTEILSYEQRNENVGGMEVTLPVVGGFRMAGSGSYCHAIFRVQDGKVVALHYTGDNDDRFGKEGVCAPIVRGCVRAFKEGSAVAPVTLDTPRLSRR